MQEILGRALNKRQIHVTRERSLVPWLHSTDASPQERRLHRSLNLYCTGRSDVSLNRSTVVRKLTAAENNRPFTSVKKLQERAGTHKSCVRAALLGVEPWLPRTVTASVCARD